MPATLLQILCLIAAVGTLTHSISVINVMSKRTSHFIRLIYCVMAAGAFSNAAFIIFVGQATLHGAIITLAIAGMCLADRRRVVSESERSGYPRAHGAR